MIYAFLLKHGLKLALGLGAVLAVWFVLQKSYNFAYDAGYAARDAIALRDAKTAADAAIKERDEALAAERGLTASVSARVQQLQGERDAMAQQRDRILRDLAAGRVRFTAPVQSCDGGPADSTTPAAGGAPQARAELEPAFAGRIFSITGEGDDAIEDLNACIDIYEDARLKLERANGNR